jgi:hypothetical protein
MPAALNQIVTGMHIALHRYPRLSAAQQLFFGLLGGTARLLLESPA